MRSLQVFKNIWAWVKCHRTKCLGFTAMFVAAIQANFEFIRDLVPEKYRPVLLFGFGMAATVIGWINSQHEEEEYRSRFDDLNRP